jgi:hypothetical protein
MGKHVITPNTFKKREKQFSQNKEGYSGWIENSQKKDRLNIVKIINRIKTGQRRIGQFKNLSQKEILRREALFMNRQAANLVYAYIDVTIGTKKYQSMDPKTKSDLWAKNFSRVMDRIIMPRIKTKELRETIEKMNDYFALPENIHKRRGSKNTWPKLKKIRDKIIASKQTPSENLLIAIERIMSKRKPGESYKVKAMDVCVAASIYADILKKTSGKRWSDSYREAMEIIFSKISVDDKLVDSIVSLSKLNPQKD